MGLILYSDIKQAVRRVKFWCIRRRKLKQRAKVANLSERGQRIAEHRQKAKEEYVRENASITSKHSSELVKDDSKRGEVAIEEEQKVTCAPNLKTTVGRGT